MDTDAQQSQALDASAGWSALEDSEDASARGGWFRRHLLVGLGLGLGLGAVGQSLVLTLARGELDATLWQRLAGVAYATACWVVLAFALACAGSLLLRVRRGGLLAVALSSVVLGVLAFLSAVGSALRIISGSYLTAGAVMFSLGSTDHFMHAAVEGYVGWFGIAMAVMVTFTVAMWHLLRPVARVPARPLRRELGVVLALLVGVGAIYAQRAQFRFTKRMFLSSPLLALVSSMQSDFALERSNVRQATIGEPLAPPGPPRAAEVGWKQVVAERKGPRPNVLLIMLESITPRHMSLFGYPRETTPRIDALASRGLVMSRAWTTATHSNYAQMAVLSSLFPRRVHGLDQYTRLDYPRVLLHDAFHELGYDTATVSSQDETWQGMRRFQETQTPTYFWYSADFEGEHLDSGVEQIVPDAATVDVALDWLSRYRDAPWALYLNLQATHFPYAIEPSAERPWQPDQPTPSTFGYLGFPEAERAQAVNRYDNAMRYVDDQVGRLVDYLEAADELDDTLIVITADHGEMFFEKGLVTHGKTLYEIESRVPIVMHWPGKVKPERRNDPVSNLDILPTVADLIEQPPHPSWQGRSFRRPDTSAVPVGIYMNIQGLRFADAMVCWPYKLILDRTSKKQFLFDLALDPDERHNLMLERPEVASKLADSLTKQLVAQLDYHREDAVAERDARFQPRMRTCPALP
jgi:arylsulfatase A-like enzyme